MDEWLLQGLEAEQLMVPEQRSAQWERHLRDIDPDFSVMPFA
jgi:hypothetical protein